MRPLDSNELNLASAGVLSMNGVKAYVKPSKIPMRCYKVIQSGLQNLLDNLWTQEQCYSSINNAGCLGYVDEYYDALEQADFS